MRDFATGPAHENAGGIFIGNGKAIFIATAHDRHAVEHTR